ncbi:hypothetical protein [Halomonas citrativorans]|uniref:hypothetical protein n=1 Tax=Halomonas citrativorans TaxID=2742612 RepID=UPI000B353612|nr:hypothetical protein [Halomonas citrativorans]
MRVIAGVVLTLWAFSAFSNQNDITFDQYEAVIEAGATHAERCKREVRLDNIGERCDRFFEYMNSNTNITRGFIEIVQRDGAAAFDGVSTSRRVAHRHYREQLTSDMAYITEMMQ